jgi:hypothetical protein
MSSFVYCRWFLTIFPIWFSSTFNRTLLSKRIIVSWYRSSKIVWFHQPFCRPTNSVIECITMVGIVLKRIILSPWSPNVSIINLRYKYKLKAQRMILCTFFSVKLHNTVYIYLLCNDTLIRSPPISSSMYLFVF